MSQDSVSKVEPEQALAGGNASGGVVRIGDTVRKVWTAATPSVISFVEAIRAAGVDAPAPMGRDEMGRQIQEFVPGCLAMDSDPLSLPELHRVGSLVRAIHDASTSFVPEPDAVWETAVPAPGDELVCHNDLAPWNLMVGDRWVFIDWDAAAPSTRLWDLAYAAQAFALSDVGREPEEAASALAAFVDGYDADRRMRERLPVAMARRTEAMYDLLYSSNVAGKEPWGSMFAAGHGEHWKSASRYVNTHRGLWSVALRTQPRTENSTREWSFGPKFRSQRRVAVAILDLQSSPCRAAVHPTPGRGPLPALADAWAPSSPSTLLSPHADADEVDGYLRVQLSFRSGGTAWTPSADSGQAHD